MRSKLQFLLVSCFLVVITQAQYSQPPSLNIGDPAPPLRLRGWLKGTPVQQFEKGKVYVVEFWATWCKPCIGAMPHLSALAGEYKDKVTFLGVDVYEKASISFGKVKAFVDSMGDRMDYHVAREDSNFMATGWLDASGDQGIPKSFVVNAEGRVAWIGHPAELDEVLSKIVSNTWSSKDALAKRESDRHLEELDRSAADDLIKYNGDPYKPGDLGKPDSALLAINELVRNEPKLKYAPSIAYNTFSALLKTNPHKAYLFGKELLDASTYMNPLEGLIVGNVEWYSGILDLPAEIYELGADAFQWKIDTYPDYVNIPRAYHKMADFYWRGCYKSKAIETEQKAIEMLKSKKDFSTIDLAAYEYWLQHYIGKRNEK